MLKILKWIVFALIVAVVSAAALLVMWAPNEIKNGIETHGSKALGAKVEVGKVELTLFPLRFAIDNFKATNPSDTMRNTIELGSIQIELGWSTVRDLVVGYLDRRELIIPVLLFDNISLDQPRSTSGALPGVAASANSTQKEDEVGAPSFKMPDFSKFIDEESEKVVRDFELYKSKLATKKEYWNERVKALPNEDTLKLYQDRVAAFQGNVGDSVVEKARAMGDIGSIKDELVRDIMRYSEAREDLKTDLLELRSQLRDLRSLPIDSLGASFNKSGVDNSTARKLLSDLLGDKLTSWLMSSLELGDVVTMSSSGSDVSKSVSGGAKWLFETIDITGTLQLRGYRTKFSGKMQGISSDPAHFGVVTRVLIEADESSKNNGKLTASAEFDHKDPRSAHDTIKFYLEKIPIRDIQLSNNAQFGIRINEGVLSVLADTTRFGERVEAHLVLNVEDTTWRLASAAMTEPWGRVLDSSLNNMKVMKLRMELEGTMDNPQISIRSNVDELLSNGISTFIEEQKTAALTRAESRLRSIIDERTRQVQGDLVGLDDFTKVLTERQFTFSDYINRI